LLVRAWPLELVNGEPLAPGATATHIAELRRDVAPELFAGFDLGVMPSSTLRALALVEAVNDLDPSTGERLSFELRENLFEKGQRIDDVMLTTLANRSGVPERVMEDIRPVEARLAQGRERGVKGSPHFFIGGSGLFCPYLDIEHDASGGLHLQERPDRLEVFLRAGLSAVP
jgi:hypothetical protein